MFTTSNELDRLMQRCRQLVQRQGEQLAHLEKDLNQQDMKLQALVKRWRQFVARHDPPAELAE